MILWSRKNLECKNPWRIFFVFAGTWNIGAALWYTTGLIVIRTASRWLMEFDWISNNCDWISGCVRTNGEISALLYWRKPAAQCIDSIAIISELIRLDRHKRRRSGNGGTWTMRRQWRHSGVRARARESADVTRGMLFSLERAGGGREEGAVRGWQPLQRDPWPRWRRSRDRRVNCVDGSSIDAVAHISHAAISSPIFRLSSFRQSTYSIGFFLFSFRFELLSLIGIHWHSLQPHWFVKGKNWQFRFNFPLISHRIVGHLQSIDWLPLPIDYQFKMIISWVFLSLVNVICCRAEVGHFFELCVKKDNLIRPDFKSIRSIFNTDSDYDFPSWLLLLFLVAGHFGSWFPAPWVHFASLPPLKCTALSGFSCFINLW